MLVPIEDAKERIARRVAQIWDNNENPVYINTGVGIPTLVPNYLKNDNVFVQAENGILGVDREAVGDECDYELINAGRVMVTVRPGASFFSSSDSFAMIRGGHIDASILGAFEVDSVGNIANWIIPNGKQLGVGGAMDLVTGAKKVIVAMQHCGKGGKIKLKKECTLPITGFNEVDMVVTEYAVFEFVNKQMILKEIAPEITLDDLKEFTEAEYIVSDDLKVMEV